MLLEEMIYVYATRMLKDRLLLEEALPYVEHPDQLVEFLDTMADDRAALRFLVDTCEHRDLIDQDQPWL